MSSLRRAWMLLGWCGFAVLQVGCAGEQGSECRASSECAGELECAGPDDPKVCGIPGTEACNSDSDCSAQDPGLSCHAFADPCSLDGVGSECRAACSEGSCGDGFRCDLDRGACEAIPCDEGWACASFEACEPSFDSGTPVHARTHGCVAISCSNDEGCPSDNACVRGVCQSGPGACVSPELVP